MAPRHCLPLDAPRNSMPGEMFRGFQRCAPPAHRRRMYESIDRCVLCLGFSVCANEDAHTAELYGLHPYNLCMMWTDIRAFHHHIATADGSGGNSDRAWNYETKLEVRIWWLCCWTLGKMMCRAC